MQFLMWGNIALVAVAALVLSARKKRSRIGWAMSSAFLMVPLIILIQLPERGIPHGWPPVRRLLGRAAAAVGVAGVLVLAGDTALTQNAVVNGLAAQVVSFMNPGVLSRSGAVLVTGGGSFEILSWGHAAFALATFGVFYGVGMRRRPWAMALGLGLLGFQAGAAGALGVYSIIVTGISEDGRIVRDCAALQSAVVQAGQVLLFWFSVFLARVFGPVTDSLESNAAGSRWARSPARAPSEDRL